VALASLLATTGEAGAENVDPTQWPAVPGLDPFLETTAHSIRFAGPDRYQTNLALNLALRGKGDYPFDSPDPTSTGAANLAAADDWWGAGTCPRSILIVASDTFADALTAASLSDPTDRSSQPRAQRVAAADPLFDPIGGFDRIDTAFAPIVVTGSARQGETALAQTARLTAADLATGGCKTAREAIIVGGTNAVPVGVGPELVELGYREVFRISGVDRFDTAARVATALGTGAAPTAGTPCLDPNVADGDARMGWYGNATVEFRRSATDCQLLGRTVVLADGATGADALAAGWWTSHWQVPVLLTAADGSLPAATRTALQTLSVDSIVVLGGVGRIPEETVNEAKSLSGAVAGRIAGGDRYGTSVEMAKAFGGWWPTGNGADFEGDVVCLAPSTGSGAQATGWPDALALGPFCGRVGGAAADREAPIRVLPPVQLATTVPTTQAGRSHDATPVLLAPTGAAALPTGTADFLTDAFTTAPWCQADRAAGCVQPGFGVLAGGRNPAIDAQLADLVAGGTYDERSDLAPDADLPFITDLDLSSSFTVAGADSPTKVCHLRDTLKGVRWLTAHPTTRPSQIDSLDLVTAGVYRADADGVARTAGVSAPVCLRFRASDAVQVTGRSLAGATAARVYDLTLERRLSLSSPLLQQGTVRRAGGASTWESSGFEGGRQLQVGRSLLDLSSYGLTIAVTVPDTAPALAKGTVTFRVGDQQFQGAVLGEAVTDGTGWRVAGRVSLDVGGRSFDGGFVARLSGSSEGEAQLQWQIDGVGAAGS
jgi:putative cell wall-binding protein